MADVAVPADGEADLADVVQVDRLALVVAPAWRKARQVTTAREGQAVDDRHIDPLMQVPHFDKDLIARFKKKAKVINEKIPTVQIQMFWYKHQRKNY